MDLHEPIMMLVTTLVGDVRDAGWDVFRWYLDEMKRVVRDGYYH